MMFCKTKFITAFIVTLLTPFIVCAAVEVEDLGGNSLDAYGIEKKFGFTSWGQMPFDSLIQITSELGSQKRSAVLADLTADVLVERTFLTPSGWNQKQSVKWFEVRVQTLLNLGKAEMALKMLNGLSADVMTPALTQLKTDAYFLTDNWEDACKLAAQNAGSDVYFDGVQMLCLGLLGQKDNAMLAFDLWREEKGTDNLTAFVMGALMDMPIDAPKNGALSVPETFVLLQLKSPYLEDATFPLPYQRLTAKKNTPFGHAVNVQKLLEAWQKAGFNDAEQAYRLYLLRVYAELYLPELRFVRANAIWGMVATQEAYSPVAFFLKDKPETEIGGADLLLGLWLLSKQMMDAPRALQLLGKGGLNMEPFVLEQINP